jgi:argininosuccinate lyase
MMKSRNTSAAGFRDELHRTAQCAAGKESGVAIRDGRLKKGLNSAFAKVNQSIDVDWRLYRQDIRGSVVYARALQQRGILTEEELKSIEGGLGSIETEIAEGKFEFLTEDEDIHMNIERRLFELIGEAAHKLHTGRSRNEQVVLDERLFLLEAAGVIEERLVTLLKALTKRAKEYLATIIPSYTHLRQAQAVSLAHLFLAYVHALRRDLDRLDDLDSRLSISPLGSGAVAGSTMGVDRELMKTELGFKQISKNSIDAVSTRDFIMEFQWVCVSLFLTLSRISEDLILFSSDEFGFIALPDDLCTTSSLMPQKKNPDSLELIRGKTSRVVGNLMSILTLMKGLPYTYNRDFQEDKAGLFDTVDTCSEALDLMTEVVKGLSVNEQNIDRILESSKGSLFATDIADYLVHKGMPFREAHRSVGSIVGYAVENDLHLKDISLDMYRKYCPLADKDIYEIFDFIRSVNCHDVVGGTALKRVAGEIKRLEEELCES